MNVHRLAASVLVRAPAKLNLFFEILAKRGDGFHEIETLMVPIGLYDTLVAADEPTRPSHARLPLGRSHAASRDTLGALPADATKSGHPRRRVAAHACRSRARRSRWNWSNAFPSAAGLGRRIERRRRGAVGGQRRVESRLVAARHWPSWPPNWAATCRFSWARGAASAAVAASGSSRSAASALCTSSSSARPRGWPRPRSMPTAGCPAAPRRSTPLVDALARGRHAPAGATRFTIAWKRRPRRFRPGSGGCDASWPSRIAWRRR